MLFPEVLLKLNARKSRRLEILNITQTRESVTIMFKDQRKLCRFDFGYKHAPLTTKVSR